MSEFTQSDTNEVIEITCSNEVLDISGGAEFKKTEKQLREEAFIKQRELQITRIKEESVNMICRQTELSEDEAKKQLEEVNYDYMKVLNKKIFRGYRETKRRKRINKSTDLWRNKKFDGYWS